MNCIYRLLLGKPVFKRRTETPTVSPNPILTTKLLNMPLPDTIEELYTLEHIVASRMSSINGISNSLQTNIQRHIDKGRYTSARNVLGRRQSLQSDIQQLGKKLIQIQTKRDELLAALH